MWAEPGRLCKERFNREGGSFITVQYILEVKRINIMFGDQVILQTGQIIIFQEAYNPVAVDIWGRTLPSRFRCLDEGPERVHKSPHGLPVQYLGR